MKRPLQLAMDGELEAASEPRHATDMEEWRASFLARGTLAEQLVLGLSFLAMVASNVLSTATEAYNGTSNKVISDANPTYLTPDGMTFSVWGFIYAAEAALVVYQALPRHRHHPALVPARRWVAVAFLLNAVWLPVFQWHRWFLALAVIVGYLYALHRSYGALRVDYGGCETWQFKAAVFTGISFNFAWVVVATLLNFTVVARNSGVITTPVFAPSIVANTSGFVAPGEAVVGGDVDWAVLCVCLASAIAVYRAIMTADVAYAFVTTWALAGIMRMQSVAQDTRFPAAALSPTMVSWAIAGMVVVAVAAVCALCLAVARSRRRSTSGLHGSTPQTL